MNLSPQPMQRIGQDGTTEAPKQHFLYFLPLPQGQGLLRPIFLLARVGVAPTLCLSL